MQKQILTGILGLLLASFAYAGKGYANHSGTLPQHTDTSGQKTDSLDQPSADQVNDDKKEFRELTKESESPDDIGLRQLNPQAMIYVEGYMEKYGDETRKIRDWGKPYLDMIDGILVQYGLPKELKYLAIVESELKNNARSWVGAVGPWQLMPETARNLGLKVRGAYDERRDYYKSTHAASKYLRSLFQLYGDWLLVIAAYNSGPGKVNSSIKKSGSTDFWILQKYLPAQTRGHVKRFVAIHYILEGQGSIVTSTKAEADNMNVIKELTDEETANSKTQSISGRYNSLVIVKHITMDITTFNKLNPDFDKLIASNGNYELRLPNDKMEMFLTKKPEILNESMQLLLKPVSSSNDSPRL